MTARTATRVFRHFINAGALLLGIIPLSLPAQLFTPGVTEPNGGPPYGTPTHYVDASAANDNGDGSIGNPWKYAPGMPSAPAGRVAQPGQIIALKRGQVWRLPSSWTVNNSGTSGNPIIFTAYGNASDPLPRVTVLKDLKDDTWTPGGGTNVYYRTITASPSVQRVYVNRVGLGKASNGTVGAATNWVGQASVVTCLLEPYPTVPGIEDGDPTQGNSGSTPSTHNTGIIKFWRQTNVSGSERLYLYSPSGAPSSLGSVEGLMSGIGSAISCTDKSYVYIDRIDFSGGTVGVVRMESSSSASPTDVRVTNCNVWGAQGNGIRVFSNSTVSTGFSNGKIKWNRVESSDGPSTKPTPDDALYGSEQPVYPGEGLLGNSDGIAVYNGVQGWEIAQNDSSNFWHANITVFRVFDKDSPSSMADNEAVVVTTGNIVEHNDVHSENINYSHGIETGAWEDVEAIAYRYNGGIVRKNKIYNQPAGASIKARNILFYGNLIMGLYGSARNPYANTGWNGEAITVWGYDKPGGVVIEGGVAAYNTFVNCAGAAMNIVGYSGGAAPKDYVVANNIMAYCGWRYTPSMQYVAFRDQQPTTSIIEVDNNLMYSPSTANVYRGDPTTTTVAGMETTEATWDDNIGGASPLFMSYVGTYTQPGSATDYILQSGSTARGAFKDISSLIPETAGWTNLGCWQDSTATTATTFVTGQTLSPNQWNTYTGWKGMQITTGSTPLVVTDLGRWVISGNNQTHTLKIVNASGTTVASTTVVTSGATAGQFNYAALTNPVTLSASSVYYIVSQETNGGDNWWGSSTTLSHTSAATINAPVRSTDSVTFATDSTTADQCNVPVSFKYYLETNFVTGQTLSSTNWNTYSGWKGMRITVGSAPIIVTQLGRWVLSGNTQAHTVKVVDSSGVTVGSVSVATSGATAGQMKYVALATPVVLAANSVYYIASQETNGGDYWWGSNTTLTHTSAATITAAVLSTDGVTFGTDTTTADHCNVPVGFKYY